MILGTTRAALATASSFLFSLGVTADCPTGARRGGIAGRCETLALCLSIGAPSVRDLTEQRSQRSPADSMDGRTRRNIGARLIK